MMEKKDFHFKDLLVWQKALDFADFAIMLVVKLIHEATFILNLDSWSDSVFKPSFLLLFIIRIKSSQIFNDGFFKCERINRPLNLVNDLTTRCNKARIG